LDGQKEEYFAIQAALAKRMEIILRHLRRK
jgi:hypothetical protein